jgi:hypothetical protein
MEPIKVICKHPDCDNVIIKRTMSQMGKKYCSQECNKKMNGFQINRRKK